MQKSNYSREKQVWRITRNFDGKSEGDYVTLWDEDPREEEAIFMFHPVHTFINKLFETLQLAQFTRYLYRRKRVYELPALNEIKEYTKKI